MPARAFRIERGTKVAESIRPVILSNRLTSQPLRKSGGGQPLDPARGIPPRPLSASPSAVRLSGSRLRRPSSAPPSFGGLATFAEDDSANVESGIWNQIPRMWKPESGIGFHKCRKQSTPPSKAGALLGPRQHCASLLFSSQKTGQGGR